MSRNLLDTRAVETVARSRFYPAVLQWISTAVFAVVLWQLLLGPAAAHDNFGTAVTWVVWWPLLPLAFLLLGRFWCAVCPFGWLSDQVQKLVGLQTRVPRLLKRYGIWFIDGCFIAITWADHVWGIVASPWGSGVLLLMMTTAVVASGAFLQKRAFCRYLCFLGGLAGNYSRAGAVELRADTDVCATCSSRAACFQSCAMFEFPRTMDTSANCNLCAACVKACPHGAISLEVRPPSREFWFLRTPRLPEAFLAAAIMGIVLVQNVTMLEVWTDVLPRLERLTGTQSYTVNYTLAFAVAVSLPVGLLALASRFVRGETVRRAFTLFGYALIPLDVAAHVAHNLFHLLAEGKSVLHTGLALLGHDAHGGSAALAGGGTIQALQFTLLALGATASLYAAYRIAGRRVTWSIATLVLLFAVLNVWLFTLPMTHRM